MESRLSPRRGAGGGGSGSNYVPITNNLVLWLDASDLGTITESSGSVSNWADKSGNGYDAIQGVGSLQPTTGATTQNGLNVIDFDGGDEFGTDAGLNSLTNGPSTIFFVARRNTETGSSERMISLFEAGVQNNLILTFSATAGQILFVNRPGTAINIANNGNTNTNFQIVRARRSGTTQALAVDGGTEASNTSAQDAPTTDGGRIGSNAGSNFLNGSICEILIYDVSLTVNERTAVETYLGNKWGV
jgi:hypothetical protein